MFPDAVKLILLPYGVLCSMVLLMAVFEVVRAWYIAGGTCGPIGVPGGGGGGRACGPVVLPSIVIP